MRMCQLQILRTHYSGCPASCDTVKKTLSRCGNSFSCRPYLMEFNRATSGHCLNHQDEHPRKSGGNSDENLQSTLRNEPEDLRAANSEIPRNRPRDQTNRAKHHGSPTEASTSTNIPSPEHEMQGSLDAGAAQPSDVDLIREPGHYFVHPPRLRVMRRWIETESRSGRLSIKQLRELETVLSEVQQIPGEGVHISPSDPGSTINTLKGKLEGLTRETWDWWPLQPHMPSRQSPGDIKMEMCECFPSIPHKNDL